MTLFSDTAQLALQGDSALSRKPSKLELLQASIHQRNLGRRRRARRARPRKAARRPVSPSPGDYSTLRFIAAFTAQRGYPPTAREMATALGYTSTHASADRVERCERKGLLTRSGVGHSRSVRLTEAGRRLIAAPAVFLQEWKCPACGASTFDPARGCFPCRSGCS